MNWSESNTSLVDWATRQAHDEFFELRDRQTAPRYEKLIMGEKCSTCESYAWDGCLGFVRCRWCGHPASWKYYEP